MKVSKVNKLVSVLWMLFVGALIAEHGYAGYRAHKLILENQVLKAQLELTTSSEIALATFVKSVIPGTAIQEEEENKDQKKTSKAANNPPPHPGIKLNGKAQ